MPSSLATVISCIDKSVPNEANRRLLHKFVDFMKSTDTSEKYQRVNLIVIILFIKFLGSDKRILEVDKKESITSFLDTLKKDETRDPDKKWIRTWNDYLQRIKYFMRWLHNDPSLPTSEWQTLHLAQIKKKKTSRLSPYVESELWDRNDLLEVIKYESHKRNKAALTLLWDLNARNHEITLLQIKHIRLRDRYGEAEVSHQSKTGSGPALLMCSFPYVRDWINEHPFHNEPNAMVICNLTTGGRITADHLATMMKQLRRRLISLMQSGSITDGQEKENLEFLIKTKKWNPYCIRHSAITADSDYLPEFALRKKARWVMNSKQPSRYIKSRMGNDLKQKILVQNRIFSENEVKPKPAVLECGRCQMVCSIDSNYCISCSYPLSRLAYEEIKAAENERVKNLEQKYEQDMKTIRQQMSSMFTMLEKLKDQKV